MIDMILTIVITDDNFSDNVNSNNDNITIPRYNDDEDDEEEMEEKIDNIYMIAMAIMIIILTLI